MRKVHECLAQVVLFPTVSSLFFSLSQVFENKPIMRKLRGVMDISVLYVITVSVTMISMILLFSQLPLSEPSASLPPWASPELIEAVEKARSEETDKDLACQLPKFELFPPKLRPFLNQAPRSLHCESRDFPKLFEITTDASPRIVPVVSPAKFQEYEILSCCLRGIQRESPSNTSSDDDQIVYAPECQPISLQKPTQILSTYEFQLVECTMDTFFGDIWNVDVLMSISDKLPAPEGNPLHAQEEKLNVIILGIDSVSRLSFLRNFPKVYSFLTVNLTAVDLEMYHKVGENTLANLLPMLSNQGSTMKDEVIAIGDCEKDTAFDPCPFIWKDFKSSGYRTLFAEDDHVLPVFNMGKVGFHDQPTDHYMKPFITTLHINGNSVGAQRLIHERRDTAELCFGPQPAFQTVLNYMERVSISLQRLNQSFFQFGWIGSVTHNFANGGRLLEKPLLEWLERLHSRNVFKNTILLIASDHGSRVSLMAGHFQGFIEDRHPFMLISMPPSFQDKYFHLYWNLLKNSKRLTTPWDVYQTLRHILILSGGKSRPAKGPGRSLFKKIPKNRTCQDAAIPEKFCTCNLAFESIPKESEIVGKCVQFMLNLIHDKLVHLSGLCEKLKVEQITQAEKAVDKSSGQDTGLYRIVMETTPYALFEGMIRVPSKEGEVEETSEGGVALEGTLARMDLYGLRSNCIDKLAAKPYCVCRRVPLSHPYRDN